MSVLRQIGFDDDAESLWEPKRQQYQKISNDAKTESAELSHAANLYVSATKLLEAEDIAKAYCEAKEALQEFRSLEYPGGIADTVRLIVHNLCLNEARKEAARMASEELEAFRNAHDMRGRAIMLLAMAEVNSDGRGNKRREDALQAARDAESLFEELQDKHDAGMALLAQTAITSKTKRANEEKGREILRLARKALVIFKGLNEKRGEAKTLHWVGVGFGLQGMYQDAIKASDEAKELFRSAKAAVLQAREAQCMAVWHLRQQDPELAIPFAAEALRIFKESGFRGEREISATQTLVQAYLDSSNPQEALKTSQNALMRAQISLDKKMEVEALLLLSRSYCSLEAPSDDTISNRPCPLEALEAAKRALDLSKELKDQEGEANIMVLLSDLYTSRQALGPGTEKREAVQLTNLKDLEGEGARLHTQAITLKDKREFQSALEKAQEARNLFSSNRHPQGEASSLLLMSEVEFERGRVDQAVGLTKEAQVIYQEEDDKRGVGDALMQIAEFRSANFEHARAVHAAERARQHLQRHGDKNMEARMLILLAQNRTFALVKKSDAAEAEQRKAGYEYAAAWEDTAKALGSAKQAMNLYEELGDSRGVGNALCVVAQMHMFTQRLEYALTAAEEASVRFVEVGDVRSEAAALVLQSQVHLVLNNLKRSLSLARQGLLLFEQAGDAQGESLACEVLVSLRRQEFVVDERAGAILPIDELDSRVETRMVASAAATDAGFTLNTSDVTDKIQKITNKMVGASDEFEIAQDDPLMDVGITSMNAVLFRNKLGNEFEGIDLPSTLVFDYPSIRSLTNLIIDRTRG